MSLAQKLVLGGQGPAWPRTRAWGSRVWCPLRKAWAVPWAKEAWPRVTPQLSVAQIAQAVVQPARPFVLQRAGHRRTWQLWTRHTITSDGEAVRVSEPCS